MCPGDRVYNIEVEGNHNYFVDGILVHNCQHGPAGSWARVMRSYPDAYRLGLSGSPMRTDGRPLGDLFDAMVVGPSVAELMALEYLVPCRLTVPPRGAELKPGQLALDPVTAYQRHGAGGLATVFCRDVAHARATAEAFNVAGISSAHVDGRMSAARRAAVLADLAARRIQVMPSVDVVTEGFDLPELEVAIMARKMGLVRWIQAIGRVLRTSPATGKAIARVIDLCGSAYEWGPPEQPREYSLTGTGIAPTTRLAFRTCVSCYGMFAAADRCPHCGAAVAVEPRALPRSAGLELVELPAPKPKAAPREYITKPFAARFGGQCARCRGPIRTGQEILQATVARTVWHASCPVGAGAAA